MEDPVSPETQMVTIYQAQDTGLDTGDPTAIEVVVNTDDLIVSPPPMKKSKKDDTLGKLNHYVPLSNIKLKCSITRQLYN